MKSIKEVFEKFENPIKILNFGAGVNSTALIIELLKRNLKPDIIIFADTGEELPETYDHLVVMREWFKKNNVNFIEVKSKYGRLYPYYFNKKTIPFRKFRDCTDKFKKIPITQFLKQFKNRGVVQYIGIGYDEVYRIRQSQIKWIQFQYPLAEWKITREKCIKIIGNEGLKIPIKSGCYLCPFQPYESWVNLFKKHPEYFKKAREIEEQNRTYPKNYLPFDRPLKEIELAIREQKSLIEFGVRNICDGWCMT